MIACVGHGPWPHDHWQVIIGAESVTCCCPGIAAELYRAATGLRAIVRYPPLLLHCPLEAMAEWDAELSTA